MKRSELEQIIRKEILEEAKKDKTGLAFALAANLEKYGTPRTPKGAKSTDLTKKQEKSVKKTAEKLKKEINEISPELFKKATDISRSRGQDQRTTKMGQTFFNKFRGKSLMGGTIKDVWYSKPSQGNYEEVGVQIEYVTPNGKGLPDSVKNDYIYYDVRKDEWNISEEITRTDARLLTIIAQYINPETKYKSGSEGFRIKGYGMSESINEELGSYMFFQNLKTIKQMVDELLGLDERMVDAILTDGHNWAEDHIATSKDDIEEVHNFLITKKVPIEIDEKELSAKQKKIAQAAPPEDKITGADFAALRAKKK